MDPCERFKTQAVPAPLECKLRARELIVRSYGAKEQERSNGRVGKSVSVLSRTRAK